MLRKNELVWIALVIQAFGGIDIWGKNSPPLLVFFAEHHVFYDLVISSIGLISQASRRKEQ